MGKVLLLVSFEPVRVLQTHVDMWYLKRVAQATRSREDKRYIGLSNPTTISLHGGEKPSEGAAGDSRPVSVASEALTPRRPPVERVRANCATCATVDLWGALL